METTNLSKIERDTMLETVNEIKNNISDQEILSNLFMMENELTKKVWSYFGKIQRKSRLRAKN